MDSAAALAGLPGTRLRASCCAIATAHTEKIFRETALALGIQEVLCAPRSQWQNAYAERLIGSIRRECLDRVIVLHEPSFRRVLRSYFKYYTHSRTHLLLEKDAPIPRAIQPPEFGKVVELREVGGLRHRYERRAA